MALIADDAHVMLAAAVSTRNVTLITDTIMCITDLVHEIQGRFMVAVKPSVGRSMTFGPSRLDPSQVSPTSFPCSKCDRKFDSLEDLTAHSKSHIDDEVHSATQRLHSLSNAGEPAQQWALPAGQMPSPVTEKPSPAALLPLVTPQPPGSSAPLKCPLCSKTFSKIFQLNIHLSRHQDGGRPGDEDGTRVYRTYNCRFCSKEFSHMSNRNKHERVCKPGSMRVGRPLGSGLSSQSAPTTLVFSCRRCKKPYADNANRLRHERMCRSGTNAIALASPGAPAAGAASNDSSGKSSSGNSLELPISVNNYKQMASTAHSMKVLDENGRQTTMYSCVICAKLVQTRSSLESHYMSHLGIKPHACQCCGKRFTDASNWRKHQIKCTERLGEDLTGGLPTMAALPSQPNPFASSAGDAAIPTDYPLIPASNDDALSIKAEVVEGPAGVDMVDVESETQKDAEGSHIAELTFEADVENGEDRPPKRRKTDESPGDVETTADASIEDDESEENKLINTANSVVVDSALSWFVEEKELTALHQEEPTS
ncbi:hypothetical protein EB796_016548 [Bugula neritina]|uniref:C2H2-type domain-containing protein n=1 Tax=Bugula neritina TaxID=10212 RepID=A0A7J7JHU3_BUGNE|nr:hypothetical protein EB796_016548 [Bugula neritina]